MAFRHTLRTRYSETGQDRVIHHPNYIIYFEVARLELFKTIECDINDLERMKIYCPVIDVAVQYLKPLYSLEDIVVEIKVGATTGVRFSLNYEVLREDVLIAKGTVSHCFVNESFKPIPIPKNTLKHLKELLI